MRYHYLLTLLLTTYTRPCYTTQHGIFIDDEGTSDEDSAFKRIFESCCKTVSEQSGEDWNVNNSAVLCYRLVPLALGHPVTTEMLPQAGTRTIYRSDVPGATQDTLS